MDVADAVGTLTSGLTAVAAIGVAVLGIVATIKLYKYVKSAL